MESLAASDARRRRRRIGKRRGWRRVVEEEETARATGKIQKQKASGARRGVDPAIRCSLNAPASRDTEVARTELNSPTVQSLCASACIYVGSRLFSSSLGRQLPLCPGV